MGEEMNLGTSHLAFKNWHYLNDLDTTFQLGYLSSDGLSLVEMSRVGERSNNQNQQPFF